MFWIKHLFPKTHFTKRMKNKLQRRLAMYCVFLFNWSHLLVRHCNWVGIEKINKTNFVPLSIMIAWGKGGIELVLVCNPLLRSWGILCFTLLHNLGPSLQWYIEVIRTDIPSLFLLLGRRHSALNHKYTSFSYSLLSLGFYCGY